MGADAENFIRSVTSRYALARGFLARLWTLVGQLTFKINPASPTEGIERRQAAEIPGAPH
jgi:hypothetical protein